MPTVARANEIRYRRAQIHRQVKARGPAYAAWVLADCEDAVRTLAISRLLAWMPRWGPDKARRALKGVAISETRACGDLTERQVTVLIRMLNPGWPI